jgi:phage tail sheath protein FI
MATNALISPGVLARENDTSFVNQRPITVGAAIIGPTVKGPVEIPTIVTSYSEYVNKFGDLLVSGGNSYSYFTSIAAYNYFANDGETLLVSRVVSGAYSEAVSTAISASTSASSQPAFVLETLSEGVIMNSTSTQDARGALPSGSVNNIRWQIINPNTSSGTFGLLIRQGNDTTNNPIVLETWTNLSLDPQASNYVSKVLGDYVYNYNPNTVQVEVSGSYPNASRYVRVKSVNLQTPNYLLSSGYISNAAYTASIPLAASGTFGGATGDVKAGANFYDTITNTNTQGLIAANYDNMINLLSNQDDYRFNVLFTPGLINDFAAHTSKISSIVANTQDRGDNIYVVDLVGYGSSATSAITEANEFDTSYAATYWPWCQIGDPATGKNVWVPASTMIAGVYAYNDKVAEPWFAPAGINRGGLSRVIRAEQKLTQANRDTLYLNKVNPIATFPGTGVVVYGQKTLQSAASALDRVNVRRLLIQLKSYISQVALNLVFEQNTAATRNQFLSQVNPYLETVQQRQGLYAFRVIMDDTNNTPDVIDRNELIGQIYLQPTKTAEFIYLDFNITPTGATFPV